LPGVGNNNLNDVTEGSPTRPWGRAPDFSQRVRHSVRAEQRSLIEPDHSYDPQNSDPLFASGWSKSPRRSVVLSADEQRVFDQIQRHHAERVETTRSPHSQRKTPLAFVVLWWVSVLTVIVGAILPGMGMAAAVGFGWLIWRYLPELGDMLEAASDVADDGDTRDPR
jgi:hypothetical protein